MAYVAVKNGINSKEVLRKIEEDERKSKRESYDETTSALNNQVCMPRIIRLSF